MDDELIKIWQSSPEEEQVKFEKSRLMIDMQSSLDRFDKLLKYGIVIEQIAALTVIPVFIFYIYFVPFMLSKIASAFIALWAIWHMFNLRRVKKGKPNSVSVNYLEYLYQTRTYLQMLKRMGDTAIYWYILPCILGCLLFTLGPIIEGVLTGLKMIMMLLFFIGVGVGAYFYIKWSTKKFYDKRLIKLDELIKTMEE